MKARLLLVLLLGCLCLMPLRIGDADSGPLYSPTERFGVGLNTKYGDITDYDVGRLHIGWYSDWTYRLNPPRPNGIEYVHVIRVKEAAYPPDWDKLRQAIVNNPGSLWLVGNEPECIWQDKRTPAEYAVIYHEVYTFIKAQDPTAKVAIGGVVQPTPLRLQWLDMVLDEYQSRYGTKMPVDVWNIHNQILREKRPPGPDSWGCGIPYGLDAEEGRLYEVQDNDNLQYFIEHIVAFRQWMKEKGERNKPLIISEYGILMPVEYGFTVDRVNTFMSNTFDYLLTAKDPELGYPEDENRLVQRWLWYSLNDKPYDLSTGEGFNGSLFDWRFPTYPGVITLFGVNFSRYTSRLLGLGPVWFFPLIMRP